MLDAGSGFAPPQLMSPSFDLLKIYPSVDDAPHNPAIGRTNGRIRLALWNPHRGSQSEIPQG